MVVSFKYSIHYECPTFNSFRPSPTTLFHVLIPKALKWCRGQSWSRSDLIIEFKAT